jgi:hypothetical protein
MTKTSGHNTFHRQGECEAIWTHYGEDTLGRPAMEIRDGIRGSCHDIKGKMRQVDDLDCGNLQDHDGG